MIRLALRRLKGDLLGIGRVHIATIEDQVERRGITDLIPFPGGAVAYVDRGDLLLFPSRPVEPAEPPQPLSQRGGHWFARLESAGVAVEIPTGVPDIPAHLELRTRLPGDRLLASRRKLKSLFNEKRVPRPYRDQIPLLALEREILACPGLLGSRRADLLINWIIDETAPILDIANVKV